MPLPRISYALAIPLIVRSLSLLLPHTFFQPDEFYQAFEPAHKAVFGSGYLTWEWRDLPSSGGADLRGCGGEWWDQLVVRGRMRSWLWPSVFVGVYKVLKVLNLDQTDWIAFAPRVIGVIVAALTDWYTYHLAAKVLGPGASAAALFLSLTSLFNAHLLPRALSTSPETLLTTMALYYFPLPSPAAPSNPLPSSLHVQEQVTKAQPKDKDGGWFKEEPLNYVAMDRAAPQFDRIPCEDNLGVSICLATAALCIRPTTLPLWAFLGIDLLRRTVLKSGPGATLRVIGIASISSLATLALSTYIDYTFTRRLYFPILTFIHQNILQNISSFYGSTNHLYHLTQSLPIMLFPIWWWWLKGFSAALLPRTLLPSSLSSIDRPDGLQLIARAITFAIGILSLSPHSEWRFLHPFLPPLLLFAIPAFASTYVALMMGCYRLSQSIRQYTRISKFPFYLALFAPILPYLYLNTFHGQAQVEVMNVLRRGELGEITALVVLMPCHSTPWMSGLHQDVNGRFVTCEPPVGVDPRTHRTQQDLFYRSPVSYLEHVFPYPPLRLHEIPKSTVGPAHPSHVLLFGELLDRSEDGLTVRNALGRLGYRQAWYGWNGFDILQDEDKRKGGVEVWRRG